MEQMQIKNNIRCQNDTEKTSFMHTPEIPTVNVSKEKLPRTSKETPRRIHGIDILKIIYTIVTIRITYLCDSFWNTII